MKKNKLGFTLTELLIVIIIIATVLSLKPTHFRDYKGSKDEAIKKACFSNLRVLQNAVDKYNDENENKMTTLDQNILLRKKYIQEKIEDKNPDERCKYLSEGDLSTEGYIYCEYHGDLSQQHRKWSKKD